MTTENNEPATVERLEMPAPTLWPIVFAASITMLGMGLLLHWAFALIGFIIFVISLVYWIALLIPGDGVHMEEMAPLDQRPVPVRKLAGEVMHLKPGMPGHRMRVPEKMHPYSAGAKGGLIGGIVMTIPALLYGLLSSRQSIWLPINLLVGMVIPLPEDPSGKPDVAHLAEFNFGYLILAIFIHITLSICLGLMYGVILPMLGSRPLLWGGLIAPLLWTGAAYGFMGVLNPTLQAEVYWPAFIVSQFVYGVVVDIVVTRSEKVYIDKPRMPAALSGGTP